ncbi:EAL domain-containing protein [Pseudolabrys sp.]|uniref:EAL domain-containing protein n=1 Tax=Pseudolabrys sp. TaxID=1960880 RepID=UPI003D119E95
MIRPDESSSPGEKLRLPQRFTAAAGPDAAQVLRSIGEAAYEWHLDTDKLTWSGNAGEVLGIADMTTLASGRAFAERTEAETDASRFDAVTRSNQRDDGKGVFYQTQYAFKSGTGDEKIRLEDTGRWFAGADGKPGRAHGVVRVITERYEREASLTQSARYDSLTGEFNRGYLFEMLSMTLDEAVRFRESCGFLLVAIDHLEQLNISYGYEVADDVIAQVAKRLRQHMRNGDHMGRFSGNKLGIILKKCSPEEITVAADRFLACIREETFLTNAGAVAVTVSIGGVTAPRHARNAQEIMARAQDALSEVKMRRNGAFAIYHPSVERETLRRESARVTDEVVAALNDRRVALAFEPVVHTKTRDTAFYECLMRVARADGTFVHANEIIPIAERVGLVRMLDRRVLELVVKELVAVPELNASVNVSAASTTDAGWWDGLGALMRAHAGVAERLIIEIIETAMIKDIDDTRGFVSRVKDLGCRIAIDDFGAGYTSFQNLRKLGVDIVKIDGAFVHRMASSADDYAFVQTLVDLARRLNLQAVAEWVPDEQTAQILGQLGCDYLQGELIGLASPTHKWQRPAEPDTQASCA